MLIKFLNPIASHDWSYPPGKPFEIEDAQAKLFIQGGNAVAVEVAPAKPANKK